jgi:hypothetical protein
MSAKSKRHLIPASERVVMAGAKAVGDVAPEERIEVTVQVRAKRSPRGLNEGLPTTIARRRSAAISPARNMSRSSSLMRCCSVVVGPDRAPLSRSPWRTHSRSVSAVQSILAAIDSIAAHCDGYWSFASKTMRTARSATRKLRGLPHDGSILNRRSLLKIRGGSVIFLIAGKLDFHVINPHARQPT